LISGLLWFRRVTLVECKKLIIQYQVLAMWNVFPQCCNVIFDFWEDCSVC
jgi:hypothetical protein